MDCCDFLQAFNGYLLYHFHANRGKYLPVVAFGKTFLELAPNGMCWLATCFYLAAVELVVHNCCHAGVGEQPTTEGPQLFRKLSGKITVLHHNSETAAQ